MFSTFDIDRLLAESGVETHFQPIASIRRHGLIGFEALSRGCVGGVIISPLGLFETAHSEGRTLELDQLCISKAVNAFAKHVPTSNSILFLNCHMNTVERPEGALELARTVCEAGLEPRRVAIEILETAFNDANEARLAVERLREQGFLLALDDVGAGHSNLDRIPFVKPDILKADRALIQGLDTDYYKQEVFKSLVQLSERIGGWIIAEGIENQKEAVAVLDLGGDLMQGYYFARPAMQMPVEQPTHIDDTAREFKRATLVKNDSNRRRHDERLLAIDHLKSALQGLGQPSVETVESCLQATLKQFPAIESACLLDAEGIQVTDTLLNAVDFDPPKTIIFGPPTRGTDHSFKEYYYLLSEAHLDPFVSKPYVPLPTHDLCVTFSTFVPQTGGKNLVLVVHMKATFEEGLFPIGS